MGQMMAQAAPDGLRVRQAAILVGGLGSRLGAATASTPKPMLPCGDRPFLAWLMRELVRFGISDFVLLAGHHAEALQAALPGVISGLPREVTVRCSVEPMRAGTGGALHHAAALLDDTFLLCNGDSLFDCNLSLLLAGAGAGPALCRMLLRAVDDTDRYGVVTVRGDQVVAFQPRAERPAAGLVNAGVYLVERGLLDHLRPVCSLESDVLPGLAAAGQLKATVTTGYFLDIGIPEDLARAQWELPARCHRPALLLDRDGTINVDHGWVGAVDRWEWIPGAREAIAAATQAGWHVFVVTNQSGIARGLYDEAALATLHAAMEQAIRRAGGTVDDIRYCPFHEDGVLEQFRRASHWRKPAPGMILDLIARWELDPARCVLVGDQPSDLAAAASAGIAGVAFDGKNLSATVALLLSSA